MVALRSLPVGGRADLPGERLNPRWAWVFVHFGAGQHRICMTGIHPVERTGGSLTMAGAAGQRHVDDLKILGAVGIFLTRRFHRDTGNLSGFAFGIGAVRTTRFVP